jgi:hypothetical protein
MANHSLFNLVVTLAWINLASTPVKFVHAYHTHYLTSLYLLDTVCGYLDLSFAPGLYDVLMSSTPPDLSFFKSLPAPRSEKGMFAVYILILEKDGCRPRLYVGKASGEDNYYYRTQQYRNPTASWKAMPSNVRKSLRLGYKITHIGILAKCRSLMHDARMNEMARLIILNLECTFSRIFFARTVNKQGFRHDVEMDAHLFADGIMPGLAYWTSVAWDGLCGHSPISPWENPHRTFGLSQDDLDRITHTKKEIRRNKTRMKYILNLKNKKYLCCGKYFVSLDALKLHKKTKWHRRAIGELPPAPPVKSTAASAAKRAKNKTFRATNVRTKRYVCPCRPSKPFTDQSKLERHQAGRRCKRHLIADAPHLIGQTFNNRHEIEDDEEPEQSLELDPGYASWSEEEFSSEEDDE